MMDGSSNQEFLAETPLDSLSHGNPEKRLFTIRYHGGIDRITVELNPGFSMADWETFMTFIRNKISENSLNWDLDLRQIDCISSMLLGAMVTLNMVIRSQHGDLRLIVGKGSRVSQIFLLSKINRIITMLEI